MRVRDALLLLGGVEERVECQVCSEQTLDVLQCCRAPLCRECLERWATESNTCPFCVRRIHGGEDRRYLNDQIGAGVGVGEDYVRTGGPFVSSNALFETILSFLQRRQHVLDTTVGRISEYMRAMPQIYPASRPIRMPIAPPSLNTVPFIFMFHFDETGRIVEMKVEMEEETFLPPTTVPEPSAAPDSSAESSSAESSSAEPSSAESSSAESSSAEPTSSESDVSPTTTTPPHNQVNVRVNFELVFRLSKTVMYVVGSAVGVLFFLLAKEVIRRCV